jgi:hypothetical protein
MFGDFQLNTGILQPNPRPSSGTGRHRPACQRDKGGFSLPRYFIAFFGKAAVPASELSRRAVIRRFEGVLPRQPLPAKLWTVLSTCEPFMRRIQMPQIRLRTAAAKLAPSCRIERT